jgi:hypothetical protein
MLTQVRAESQADDDVIAEAVPVLASGLQNQLLLEVGERPRRLGDGIGIGGHGAEPPSGQ